MAVTTSDRPGIERRHGSGAGPHLRAAVLAFACAASLAFGMAVSGPAHAAAAPADGPPYDEQILRLAEIMGALHHLRPLCGADEGQMWRDKMNALIQAEEPAPDRRKRIIERFNRSYRALAEVYRTCTPAAREIVDQYLREGAKLSRDVVSRYGRQ
ncbi:TIGR02301 family protein [Methyloraptor flagellatus]|uniref:TIGR02301 family protein n=1 Tax=Methyloraptor flagellatus TaxID=3162530 RepID=A0AAU7X5U8_9HYPH